MLNKGAYDLLIDAPGFNSKPKKALRWKVSLKGTGINEKGFTLLELVLVLLFTGLIVALALPSLQHPLAHYRLYSAARELEAQIREYQQRAITEEKGTYEFRFYTSTASYVIKDGMQTLQTVELHDTLDIKEVNFGGDIYLGLGTSGCPWGGFGGHVLLENNYGDQLWVIVVRTGRVRVDDEPPAGG